MFGKKFQRTYALTDQGMENTRRGGVLDGDHQPGGHGGGMGILYLLMGAFMETLTDGAPSARGGPFRGPGGPVCPPVFFDPLPAV